MRWIASAAIFGSALLSFYCPPLNAQQPAAFSALFDGRSIEGFSFPVFRSGPPVRGAGPSAAAASGLLEDAHYRAKQGHRPLSYADAKYAMFSAADSVRVNGVRGVVAVYSGVFVPGSGGRGSEYRERGDQNGDDYIDAGGMNAEHVWPQSYFKKRLPMRSDLHNLLPAFMHPNSVRGRLPFAEVADADADYGTAAGARRGAGGFEPPDFVKGRVARAMLYFYTRYLGYNIIPSSAAGNFWNVRIEMLLRWNREHPPEYWERRRNDLVERVQGNRNPFIDDPGLAERLGAEALRMRRTGGLYASAGIEPMAPAASRKRRP